MDGGYNSEYKVLFCTNSWDEDCFRPQLNNITHDTIPKVFVSITQCLPYLVAELIVVTRVYQCVIYAMLAIIPV